jgi:rRNA-processing protein FCF1
VKPRKGVELDGAVGQLRRLVTEGGNVRSSSHDPERVREQFLVWVHDVERALLGLFTDVRLGKVHTERFWRIHSSPAAMTSRAFELISDELEIQISWLHSLAGHLEEEASRAAYPGSTIAVTDTNALLHYRLFNEVPWPEIVGASPVRLVVPLRVVDELDAKKAARRTDLADRAATVLTHLEQRVGPAIGSPAPLRENVTIEVFRAAEIDPEPQRPAPNADTEVLDTCEALAFFSRDPVHLITGDYGMRLRAAARGVQVIRMPDDLQIRQAPQQG